MGVKSWFLDVTRNVAIVLSINISELNTIINNFTGNIIFQIYQSWFLDVTRNAAIVLSVNKSELNTLIIIFIENIMFQWKIL